MTSAVRSGFLWGAGIGALFFRPELLSVLAILLVALWRERTDEESS